MTTTRWRRCPRCGKAGPEDRLRDYKWYGGRRNRRLYPHGFRCPSCGHQGDGFAFRYAKRPGAPTPGQQGPAAADAG
jgi:hypothetical protein